MSVKKIQTNLDRMLAVTNGTPSEQRHIIGETMTELAELAGENLENEALSAKDRVRMLAVLVRWLFQGAATFGLSATKFIAEVATETEDAAGFMEQASGATTIQELLQVIGGYSIGAEELLQELLDDEGVCDEVGA